MTEAEWVRAILEHLLRQGYAAQDIVVLTPYAMQLRLLQLTLGKHHIAAEIGELDVQELERQGVIVDTATPPGSLQQVRTNEMGGREIGRGVSTNQLSFRLPPFLTQPTNPHLLPCLLGAGGYH